MALMSLTTELDRSLQPYRPAIDSPEAVPVATSDWKTTLPVLLGSRVALRELRLADAPALLSVLTTEEVTRFISPPPTTVEGFERFITWANAQRAAGTYICFAVVPHGSETAIGIIQVRQLDPGFGTAEWGFAIGQAFWGTGLFVQAAELVLAFAFETVGVHRLEARAAVMNGRGTGALQKLGAHRDAVLRKSFSRNGCALDQALWSILEEDWRTAKWSAKAVWASDRQGPEQTAMMLH
jgi:ribosomal-protein-alanine N-acetyltransferase